MSSDFDDGPRECKYDGCDVMITWTNPSGRWVPLGPDGEPHRPNCKGAPPKGSPDSRGARSGLQGTDIRQIVREELREFGRVTGLLKAEQLAESEPDPDPEPEEDGGSPGW